MLLSREIVPPTSKIIVRVPDASSAALRLPAPLSFKLVTFITEPPLPPDTYFPNPSAFGNAGV